MPICAYRRNQPIFNLTLRGKRVRLALGLVGCASVGAGASCLVLSGAEPIWRLSLFIPAAASILCLLEAHARTCVVLAALGAWDVGCGTQRVPDRGLEAQLRHRAWRLAAYSGLISGVLCLFLFLL